MKAKTIKSVLKKKINAWAASIEDEAVKKLVEKNTIVTGGCIASMLLKEPVNDFDIYFRNRETAIEVANYYVDRFKIQKRNGIPCKIYVDSEDPDRIKIMIKSAGIASEEGAEKPYQYFESRGEGEAGEYVGEVMSMDEVVSDTAINTEIEKGIINDPGEIEDVYDRTEQMALNTEDDPNKPAFRPIFMSTNAITLSNKIQIVLRFYGNPEQIHANYDFVHCTNYWDSLNEELVLRKEALECLLTKELLYVGSKYPICSIFRLRKFIRRGWMINAGQILKICMQISELDLTNINVLQDQTTGVDVAYFIEVINKLKEKDPVKVNVAYLCEILDRMF